MIEQKPRSYIDDDDDSDDSPAPVRPIIPRPWQKPEQSDDNHQRSFVPFEGVIRLHKEQEERNAHNDDEDEDSTDENDNGDVTVSADEQTDENRAASATELSPSGNGDQPVTAEIAGDGNAAELEPMIEYAQLDDSQPYAAPTEMSPMETADGESVPVLASMESAEPEQHQHQVQEQVHIDNSNLEAPIAAANSNGNLPPPILPPTEHGSFDYDEGDNVPEAAPSNLPSQDHERFAPPSSVPELAVTSSEDLMTAEDRGRRRGMIAGFLTGAAITGFLMHRRNNKLRAELEQDRRRQAAELEEQIGTQQERIQHLEQQRPAVSETPLQAVAAVNTAGAAEALAVAGIPVEHLKNLPPVPHHAEKAAAEAVAKPAAEAIKSIEAQQEEPSSSQRAEHASADHHVERAGWYSVVKDKLGHVVENEIEYGEAYRQERNAELLAVADRTVAAEQQRQAIGAPQVADGNLPSGLTSAYLPSGYSEAHDDPSHQLTAGKKQILKSVANPWFWLMLVIIILAFFAAALL